jgi:hypothetical protein
MRKIFFALVVLAIFAPAAMAISTSIQATIANFGYHIERWNIGMMTALMANLDATSGYTTCVGAAILTSKEILKMLDFANYLNGNFNLGIFMESINVMTLLLMQQFEFCGVNELFIKWDQMMSHVSDISGAVVNLSVVIGTGWANKDTYPFKVYDLWIEGWKYSDWSTIGKGFQLLMAQIAKFDAPEIVIEVETMF